MQNESTAANNLSEMERQADCIVDALERDVESMKGMLSLQVSYLHDYVYSRELTEFEGECGLDRLYEAITMLGGAIDMITNNDYLGSTPAFLFSKNPPLKALLTQAEKLLMLDFPEEASWSFYSSTNHALHVFSLEEFAELSGRTLGSLRNLTMKGGSLATVKLEGVKNKNGEVVNQSVFIEYAEALRWLETKNCYEPLKDAVTDEVTSIEFIRQHGPCFDGSNLPKELQLRKKGQLEVFYAPFEHINHSAKVVLCGITPGAAQTEIALNTLSKALRKGASIEEGLKEAKQAASFAGSMRGSLSKMLDHVGLNKMLEIESCSSLFDEHKDMVHYTSALKNPVFYKGGNYTGNPLMLNESALKWQVDDVLAQEVKALNDDVLYIPLGPKPADALMYLVNQGVLKREQILAGIPHPSGANAERIKYFCGEKNRSDLSSRTNAEQIDQSREQIQQQLNYLMNNANGAA